MPPGNGSAFNLMAATGQELRDRARDVGVAPNEHVCFEPRIRRHAQPLATQSRSRNSFRYRFVTRAHRKRANRTRARFVAVRFARAFVRCITKNGATTREILVGTLS